MNRLSFIRLSYHYYYSLNSKSSLGADLRNLPLNRLFCSGGKVSSALFADNLDNDLSGSILVIEIDKNDLLPRADGEFSIYKRDRE